MAEPGPRRRAAGIGIRNLRWRKRLIDLGWALYGAGTVVVGGSMWLSGILGLSGPMPIWLALPTAIFGLGLYAWPALLAAGLFVGRKRALVAGEVERSADGSLVVHGPRPMTVPAASLAQGAVVGGALVVEDEGGREISIETPDAAKLLDELDLEPALRRFRFRWRRASPRLWSFLGTLFATSFLASIPLQITSRSGDPSLTLIGCMLVSAPWLVAELVSRWYAIRELTVGLDGLAQKSRLGKRFVRFADVASVESSASELVFVMKDGRRERVLCDPDEPGLRRAIEDRIREARAVAAEHAGEGSAVAAMLERAGRTLPEWRAAAARVLTAATGFRQAAITPEEIGAVIDDATAPAEQRVAAAIALGTRGDPESRARIRVAADACASPKLRVALESLADGSASDEAIEAAIEEERPRRTTAERAGAR